MMPQGCVQVRNSTCSGFGLVTFPGWTSYILKTQLESVNSLECGLNFFFYIETPSRTLKVWTFKTLPLNRKKPCLNSYVGKCLKYPWERQCFVVSSTTPHLFTCRELELRNVDFRAFLLHNTPTCCAIYSVLHPTPPCFAAIMTQFPFWHAWPSRINKVNLMLPYLI